ncbi:MAG: hypothetical protein N4A36_00050 [Candidatus Gracilibacteria bacterium]|nr:hypothetical protein [Candidatus Gracilibacteria bacterium]
MLTVLEEPQVIFKRIIVLRTVVSMSLNINAITMFDVMFLVSFVVF